MLSEKNIELKFKVMLQRINKLTKLFKMLYGLNCKEAKNITYIKEKYIEGYNVIIQEEVYDKYSELENIIIKEISKIELQLDEYIYKTRLQYKDIILAYIEKLENSESYQNFQGLEYILQSIETLEELTKLYGSDCELQDKITKFKFDVLYRKQVEELVYQNGGKDSNLIQYENEREKNIFIEMLKEKIKSLYDPKGKNDQILKIEPKEILSNGKLLERLIVMDMDKNPFNYINLVRAPIFNAHLCNIGNNPFEKEVYLTSEQWKKIVWDDFKIREGATLKTNKVNFSILYAVLRNLITDEDISIIECERIYQKFGFECRPIMIGIGQKCVKMIFDKVHNSERFKQMINEKNETKKEEGFCKLSLTGLAYDFDYEEKEYSIEDLKGEIIDLELFNAQHGKRKNKQYSNNPNYLDTKVEQIKKTGIITTNIDMIILLIQDMINKESNTERRNEEKIEQLEKRIKHFEGLKGKRLSLEENKEILMEIKRIYLLLDIEYNEWELPLEDMREPNRYWGRIMALESAPIPIEEGYEDVEVSHSFAYGSKYESRYYCRSYTGPLWEKYKMDFKGLGIEVFRNYSSYRYSSGATFNICINLANISDLPIDYEKVQMMSKQEMDRIIKREEENERDG